MNKDKENKEPIFLEVNRKLIMDKVDKFNKYVIVKKNNYNKIHTTQKGNQFIFSIIDIRNNQITKIKGEDTITITGNTIWENFKTLNKSQDIFTRALDQLRDKRLGR